MLQEVKEMAIDHLIDTPTEFTYTNRYKLRLSSKKLQSGRCQVKFYATVENRKDMYGYVLVESGKTLKEVVRHINAKLETIRKARDFQQIHLYSIGKTPQDEMNFIIFDA